MNIDEVAKWHDRRRGSMDIKNPLIILEKEFQVEFPDYKFTQELVESLHFMGIDLKKDGDNLNFKIGDEGDRTIKRCKDCNLFSQCESQPDSNDLPCDKFQDVIVKKWNRQQCKKYLSFFFDLDELEDEDTSKLEKMVVEKQEWLKNGARREISIFARKIGIDPDSYDEKSELVEEIKKIIEEMEITKMAKTAKVSKKAKVNPTKEEIMSMDKKELSLLAEENDIDVNGMKPSEMKEEITEYGENEGWFPEVTEDFPSKDDLEKMNKKDLVDVAETFGIDIEELKKPSEILEAIIEHGNDNDLFDAGTTEDFPAKEDLEKMNKKDLVDVAETFGIDIEELKKPSEILEAIIEHGNDNDLFDAGTTEDFPAKEDLEKMNKKDLVDVAETFGIDIEELKKPSEILEAIIEHGNDNDLFDAGTTEDFPAKEDLEKMNKKDLVDVAETFGIDIEELKKPSEILEAIIEHGNDNDLFDAGTTEDFPSKEDLENMNKKDLVDVAETFGIDIEELKKPSEILEAIIEHGNDNDLFDAGTTEDFPSKEYLENMNKKDLVDVAETFGIDIEELKKPSEILEAIIEHGNDNDLFEEKSKNKATKFDPTEASITDLKKFAKEHEIDISDIGKEKIRPFITKWLKKSQKKGKEKTKGVNKNVVKHLNNTLKKVGDSCFLTVAQIEEMFGGKKWREPLIGELRKSLKSIVIDFIKDEGATFVKIAKPLKINKTTFAELV